MQEAVTFTSSFHHRRIKMPICRSFDRIGVHGEHFHVCKSGNYSISKHDEIQYLFIKMCCSTGILCIKEPTGTFPAHHSQIRTDTRLRHPRLNVNGLHNERDLLLDFTITHAGIKSNVKFLSDKNDLSVANHAFNHKKTFLAMI